MPIYGILKQILCPPSEVVLTDDTNRTGALNITQRWNAFNAPSYVVYAKPATNEDVKKIVCFLSPLPQNPGSFAYAAASRLTMPLSMMSPSLQPVAVTDTPTRQAL